MPTKKILQRRKGFGENEHGITSNSEHHNNASNMTEAMKGDIRAILNIPDWEAKATSWKVKFLLRKVGISPTKNKITGKYEFDPRLNIMSIPIEEYDQEYAQIKKEDI